MEKIYTKIEVARICQVDQETVLSWIHRGDLPATFTLEKGYLIRETDLIEVMRELKINGFHKISVPKKSSSKSVLIVDDDADFRTLVSEILHKHFPDLLVEEADNGFIAGYKIKTLIPDLVILDAMMPVFSGFEVCRLIRQFEGLEHVKIIAITGKGELGVHGMMDAGADHCLMKPFEIEELVGIIEQYFPS